MEMNQKTKIDQKQYLKKGSLLGNKLTRLQKEGLGGERRGTSETLTRVEDERKEEGGGQKTRRHLWRRPPARRQHDDPRSEKRHPYSIRDSFYVR